MSRHLIETEESLIIETPERVPLEFAVASIGNRFLAVALDHFLQYMAIVIVAWIFLSIASADLFTLVDDPGTMFSQMPKWTIAIMILVIFLIFASYFILFEWLWNGQTPGKRLLKLRVIREDGRPITLWEAVTRNLLRIGDAIPGFVVPIYSVGLIVLFMNNRDQRLGDIFAGTVVIRERIDEAPTFAATFLDRRSDTAFTRVQKPVGIAVNVSLLTEPEIEVVENFLRRRWDLDERQRQWMAWRIALPLLYKLKPAYDLNTFTYEGFLEEVLHRFHFRQQTLN